MKLIIVIVLLLFVTLTEQKSKKSHTASYRLIKAACAKRMKSTSNSPTSSPETRDIPFIYNLLNYLEKRSGNKTPGYKVDSDHFASGKHLSLNTARILADLIRPLKTTTSEINEQEIQDLLKRLLMKKLNRARKRKLNKILRRFTGTVRHSVVSDVIVSGDPKVGLDMVCSIMVAGLL